MGSPSTALVGSFRTVSEAMDATVDQHGDREAYVEGDRRVSFAEWLGAADSLAASLVERGVRSGDVVAMFLPSSTDYAVCYAAVARAGAVASGINTRLGRREVDAILERCRPTLLILDQDIPWPGSPPPMPVLRRDELPAACTGPGLGAAAPRREPSDPVAIIWTSGTTGVPKGAWFDHRNLEAAVATAGVMSEPYDRRLVSIPFAHAGYMAKLWDQLAYASTNVISPVPWSADDMLRLIVDERITAAGGVPTQWAKLLEHPGLDDADVSSVRLCLAATAPAPPDLIERVTQRFGCPMIVRYAMTESPSISGTEPGDPPEVLFRTVGRPQAGIDLLLVDGEGREVPRGEVGRVRLRGGTVMRGYWNAPELNEGVLSDDGWLTSTDLGYFDTDGNLVLVGRTGDMYIRGGYNVYPTEVEHVLDEHPGVDQAAVVGLTTPVIGEIGVAFVVPSDPTAVPSLEDLRAWVKDRLADYKAPDRLELVDALPLTPMMKVDKLALQERLT